MESDDNKKKQIEENIAQLDSILDSVNNLLKSIQTNLDIPESEVQKANSKIAEKLVGVGSLAELLLILSPALLLGGSKKNKTKVKKGKLCDKKTKRNKKNKRKYWK
jgi:hypothetical protein